LNQKEYDRPTDKALPQLSATLRRFKAMSDSTHTPVMVTVVSAPKTRYERVVDVLDACASAQLKAVTFTTEGE
jgi:biopolymer transport protein ExbD